MQLASKMFSGLLAVATVPALAAPTLAATRSSGHEAERVTPARNGLVRGHEGFHAGHYGDFRGHGDWHHNGYYNGFYGWGHDRDDWHHHHYYYSPGFGIGVYEAPSYTYVAPPTYYYAPPVYAAPAPAPIYQVNPPAYYYDGGGLNLGFRLNFNH